MKFFNILVLKSNLPYSYPLAGINHCFYQAKKLPTPKELFVCTTTSLSALFYSCCYCCHHHQVFQCSNNSITAWFSLLHFKLNNRLCISFYLPSLFQSSSNYFNFTIVCMHSMHWSSERLGSLIPACERQVCLADVSVRVLWPKRRQDKPVFHTLESENPTFLMTTPVEKPALNWSSVVNLVCKPQYTYTREQVIDFTLEAWLPRLASWLPARRRLLLPDLETTVSTLTRLCKIQNQNTCEGQLQIHRFYIILCCATKLRQGEYFWKLLER